MGDDDIGVGVGELFFLNNGVDVMLVV